MVATRQFEAKGDSEAQSKTPDKTQNHNFEAQSGSRWVHITTRNETPSQTQMDDFGGDGGRVGGIEHDNPPWISLKISSMVKKNQTTKCTGRNIRPAQVPLKSLSSLSEPLVNRIIM